MEEIWKSVVGYEGLYEVSNLGNARSLDREVTKVNGGVFTYSGKILSKSKRPNGYYTVNVTVNNICKRISVHRLVAISFIPNVNKLPQVNHINGIKTDNRVENLEWCTQSENTQHAIDTGLIKILKGPKVGNSLLNRRGCQRNKSENIKWIQRL